MDPRFTVLVRSAPPAGCRCVWVASCENFGADTVAAWRLKDVNPSCPIHKWLESQPYPVVKDS